jgi:hypothetical protein
MMHDMAAPITKSRLLPQPIEALSNAHQANDNMRQHWNDIVCREFDLPDHYQSVAVLLIHWAERLDQDLNCRGEVSTAYQPTLWL